MWTFIIAGAILILSVIASKRIANMHRKKFWDHVDDPEEGAGYVALSLISLIIIVSKVFFHLFERALQ